MSTARRLGNSAQQRRCRNCLDRIRLTTSNACWSPQQVEGHQRSVSISNYSPVCTTIALKVRRQLNLSIIASSLTNNRTRSPLPQTDSSSIPHAAVSSSASSVTISTPLRVSIVLAQFHLPQPALRSSAQLWPLALAHLLLLDSCASDHAFRCPR